ncbi:hypothetical protein [Saccharothrix violaceirubra]|uniref:Uncharacterized protein n=1 Tax=Saccharothrix violaceirubra TaxID=413306 RepID=A0A7W7WV99_9PSEU|nr:hypothetical protein [Saccharothrix violaceirubra]MBB4964861.1 hypothetical protein [Saccharothrix violaceirubra]
MTHEALDPVIARLLCGELARRLRVEAGLDPGTASRDLREVMPSF